MKNLILIFMKVSMKKKKIITLINKEKINTMIITLIKKIKDFLKTKYKFNLKIKIIIKVFINIKRDLLKINTFIIINNIK